MKSNVRAPLPMKMFTIFAVTMVLISPAQGAEIVGVSDEWCPYNCEPESSRPGYTVEVATDILANAGHTFTYLKIPWARALKGLQLGKYHIALGAYKRSDRNFLYPSETIGKSIIGFSTFIDSNWTFDGVESLRRVKSGIIRGYAYHNKLDSFFKANPSLVTLSHGSDALERSFKLLVHGKVGTIVGDINVLQEKARQLNLSTKIRNAGNLKGGEDLYLAISEAHPDSRGLAKIISNGIIRLRKSGRLKLLLSKY
ncbi:MAG: transporter substrate-binding domain-containing protein, partial [Rhodospirillaceae bacterium]|nr:transporter substrate-binding domain-containing protein [Rhodospirillaceae bacterium]